MFRVARLKFIYICAFIGMCVELGWRNPMSWTLPIWDEEVFYTLFPLRVWWLGGDWGEASRVRRC